MVTTPTDLSMDDWLHSLFGELPTDPTLLEPLRQATVSFACLRKCIIICGSNLCFFLLHLVAIRRGKVSMMETYQWIHLTYNYAYDWNLSGGPKGFDPKKKMKLPHQNLPPTVPSRWFTSNQVRAVPDKNEGKSGGLSFWRIFLNNINRSEQAVPNFDILGMASSSAWKIELTSPVYNQLLAWVGGGGGDMGK